MGRKVNEMLLNHKQPAVLGRGMPPISGGVRTVRVSGDHLQQKRCPICDAEHYRKLTKIFAVPRQVGQSADGLAFVDVMSCRGCGWVMANENTPAFVLDHGRLRSCSACGCECHEENFTVSSISRLITGGARDQIVLRQVYFCARCGRVFDAEPAEVGERVDHQ